MVDHSFETADTSCEENTKRPTQPQRADHSKISMASSIKRKSKPFDPQIRAANEDDDGYDPYSDRVERTPLFEPDPWN